jgi:hypothetical protein
MKGERLLIRSWHQLLQLETAMMEEGKTRR